MASPTLLNTSAQLNGQLLIQSATTVTLTDAQIKALPTTAITILASPGAGFIIVPWAGWIKVNSTAGAYTNVSTGTNNWWQLLYGTSGVAASNYIANDSTLSPARTYLTILLTAAGIVSAPISPYTDSVETNQWGNLSVPVAHADGSNKALVLMGHNTGGNYTGGNVANSATVRIYYTIEAI